MSGGTTIEFAGEVNSEAAWSALAANPKAALVDVRTDAEWSFVGIPDLGPLSKRVVLQSWQRFPAMDVDPSFAETVLAACAQMGADEVYFICRSGARSRQAAMSLVGRPAPGGSAMRVVNVEDGFEGNLDSERHRGRTSGWKASGLPWVQS